MKIYVIVKHTYSNDDDDYTYTSEIIKAYGNKQDAAFEAKWLRIKSESYNVTFYVEETNLL